MRRPGKSAAQRVYDRQARALLMLRRAAVRHTNAVDALADALLDTDTAALEEARDSLTLLEAMAAAYTGTLTATERRKLGKGDR